MNPFATSHILVPFLILIYLCLPMKGFVHAFTLDAGTGTATVASSVVEGSTCPDCPCSDENEGSCCDAPCCCTHQAPPAAAPLIRYAPIISAHRFHETRTSPPQVWLPIFVPPQNHS
jgi:hypothetical protein